MNNRYLATEVNKNKEKNISDNFNTINLEENYINSERSINILKYLTELEKQNTIQAKKKINLKFLPKLKPASTRYNQNKLNKSLDINNVLTLKQENNSCNKDDGCFITSLDIEKKRSDKNYGINNEKNKNIKDKLLKANKNKRNMNNKYNLASIIKDIKRKNSSYVSKTEGNYFNDYIAYDNKNMKNILDINNIINTHLKNEEWNLKARDDKYNEFLEIKKGGCVQNLIIKLIKEEREKLKNKYTKFSYDFNNKIKMVTEGEKMFEKIIVEQKKNIKMIENNYYKLKNDNKALIILRERFKDQVSKTEYEIIKKIYEIDELRYYAKFVNYIYGYDTSIYETKIIDDDYSKKPKDAETLIKFILENYKHFLINEKDDIINNIDPDIVLNETRLIEDRILMNLKLRDQEYEDLKKYKLNNKNILKNIENRKKELEDEYNYIQKEIKDIIINTQINLDEDLFSIMKDLGIFILETLSKDKQLIKKFKTKLNLFEISDLATKSIQLVLKRESVLDYYINTLEKYDKDDKKTFNMIINKRKLDMIREKIDYTQRTNEKKLLIDKIEITKNSDKIYFIQRKALPSIPKKKKKIIKIDPEIIKAKENKELISYD
jgi:hypothetical protein